MKLFFNSLKRRSNPTPVSAELFDVERKLTAGVEVSSSALGFYFFRPYLVANFSTINYDTKYFFVWSTDHGSGKMFVGKGNNLDLSDFVDLGQINIFGNQIETPFLMERNGKLLFYCHTDSGEIGNDSKQQTQLYTYQGAANELQLIPEVDWLGGTRPFGIVGDENHTGYGNFYERENDILAFHLTYGGLPQMVASSISTDGGYTYTRLESPVDLITGVEENYYAQLQDGRYFDWKGKQFFLGHIHPQLGYAGASLVAVEKKMIVAETTNTRYSSVTQKAQIYPDLMLRSMPFVDVENGISHHYFTKGRDHLYYGKYDLNNLNQWL